MIFGVEVRLGFFSVVILVGIIIFFVVWMIQQVQVVVLLDFRIDVF